MARLAKPTGASTPAKPAGGSTTIATTRRPGEGTRWLLRGDVYPKTHLAPGASIARVDSLAPPAGDFGGTGLRTLVFSFGASELRHLTFSGTYSATAIFTGTNPISAYAAGNVDTQPGDDIVLVTVTNPASNVFASNVFLLSGNTWAPTPLGTAGELLTALACADLDGDGKDEVYAGGYSGGVYQYAPGHVWRMIDSVPSVDWNDGARARWTGETRDRVVFLARGPNVTVREYRLSNTAPDLTILAPAEGTDVALGAPLTLAGDGIDAEASRSRARGSRSTVAGSSRACTGAGCGSRRG